MSCEKKCGGCKCGEGQCGEGKCCSTSVCCARCCVKIDEDAPNFKLESVHGTSFAPFELSAQHGKWVLLFFYPLDFTFVCPTEILALNDRVEEFKKKNCVVVGLSVDSVFTHLAWQQAGPEAGGLGKLLDFALAADLKHTVSVRYGAELASGHSSRLSVYVDPKGKVRYVNLHPPQIGRSIDELIRVLDALQAYESSGEVCPVNWKAGSKTMATTLEARNKTLGAK